MGRRTMNKVKTLAKLTALTVMTLWCLSFASAAQNQPPQRHPAQVRPQTSATQQTLQPVHKTVVATTGAVHSHPMIRPSRKVSMVRPKPKPAAATQHAVAKKPVEAVKPPAVKTPALPTAAALADQTPAYSDAGHGRDPFAALVRQSDPNDAHSNLPPGIAGLQVATVRIEGMVKTPDGMVAVVQNPQDSVYFLHDGDRIFDGVVEKIGIDGITFRQESKDAFGRTVDRDVSKRLYPIAGDEQ